jgi:hypothetical protein
VETRYIDTRPRAPNAVFAAEVIGGEAVRLMNVETKRTHTEYGEIFRRHYERMDW